MFGLVVGFVTVYLLPGTSARQAEFARLGLGFSAAHGLVPWLRLIAHVTAQSLGWPLLSPGPVLGFVVGWLLRRNAATPTVPIDREKTVIRVVGRALAGTTVASWALIMLGDIASYPAWWHYWPLWIEFTILGALVGWRVAAVRRAARPAFLRWAELGVVVVWCVSVTAFAAAATWERRSTVDANVAAARARVDGRSAGPVVWQAAPVGGIADMETDWVQAAVAQWFGLAPTDFRIVTR